VVITGRNLGLKCLNRSRLQELNEANRHTFIKPDLWPLNSHDLNSVDYIYGIIQQRVYQTKAQDVNDLRQRLIDVWTGKEQSVIDDAIA